MNRPIKFRAWNTDTKRMLPPSYTMPMPTDTSDVTGTLFLQWTGLTDKNGKEIYEGDVLQIMNRDVSPYPKDRASEESYSARILYDGAEFFAQDLKTGGTWHFGGWYKHEVIGNIYENPELLSV